MDFAIGIIAVYVITSVFIYSSGPWRSLETLRNNQKMKEFGLLDCFLCTSFWVALVFGIISHRADVAIVAWGAAYFIDQVVSAYRIK